MMASSSQQRPPSDPPNGQRAEDYEDEATDVRARMEPSRPRRVRYQSGVWQSAEPTDKSERLEHKLKIAKALLASMPVAHPRARLLRIAIVRRDEVVLDGILSDLNAKPR